MKHSTDGAQGQLIQILAKGGFHSGEYLGQQLGVSRATISNYIKHLSALGIDIQRVTGKGYRLAAGLRVLSATKILAGIPLAQRPRIEVLGVVDSTNLYIKQRFAELDNGHICLAEAQTAGKGRRGRPWVSPYGASIYLSMYWHFTGGYAALGGLSLTVGVIIAETLEQVGVEGARLKWPNDIYLNNKKLSGVLIEVEGDMQSGCDCVIGIGLNVCLPEDVTGIDQPWTDISSVLASPIDRNGIVAKLIGNLYQGLQGFDDHGLQPFVARWQARDLYANQSIKLVMGNKEVTGIGQGIDANGALKLSTPSGIKVFHGGEISVRAN